MPNALASLVLLLWPVATFLLLRYLPRGRALIACLLIAYLFLPPPPAGFDFPLMPPLTKESIPNISLAVASFILWRPGLRIWPETRFVQALLVIFVFSPFATVLTNGEPVFFGQIGLPGLRIVEAIALVVQQAIFILPFLLARAVMNSDEDQRDIIIGLFITGLIYSVLMLIEVRMSPQLNIWIYGFFQHNFGQMIRSGGFRPIVFLYHGIWVSFFAMTALLAAAALLRAEPPRRMIWLGLSVLYLYVVLYLSKTLAAFAYGTFLLPVVILFGRKLQLHAAMLMACLAIGYPVLKGADLVPKEALLSVAERIDPDRANSLRFRFDNETILLERAYEKPAFGWGIWGRNHILDDVSGQILTVTDGRWIIQIGTFGWLGFLAEMLLLATPIFLLWGRTMRGDGSNLSPYVGVLAVMLGVNMVDLIPNATLTPLTWLFAGAVLGYAEKFKPKHASGPAAMQTVL